MRLDFYQQSVFSRELIVQYEQIQAHGENISVVDRHIPSGYASLVFNLSGRVNIEEESVIELPPYFMVVPLFRAINIGVYGNINSFIITCRASILSKLLSINFSSAKDSYYRIVNCDTLCNIYHKLQIANCVDQRLALLDDFFRSLELHNYQKDEIDNLYNLIIESNGSTPITQYIDEFNKSPRYFRQHFIERVGVNAKTLARIVRVNHLWSMIMKGSVVDFQDMVFEGGYFDQAHLIHDFKKIVGETPSFFFKRNLDNVMLISGKQ